MVEYRGLTSDEAVKRLEIFGPNKVPEKKESLMISFLKKFTGLTPYKIVVEISFTLGNMLILL
uniref:Cation-transporting P-type ATPase N-terminal domain-containing protein n=1 Tax=Ignisphaera aggregans TaxID=334771 RepID=A0A832FYH8_9CREN